MGKKYSREKSRSLLRKRYSSDIKKSKKYHSLRDDWIAVLNNMSSEYIYDLSDILARLGVSPDNPQIIEPWSNWPDHIKSDPRIILNNHEATNKVKYLSLMIAAVDWAGLSNEDLEDAYELYEWFLPILVYELLMFSNLEAFWKRPEKYLTPEDIVRLWKEGNDDKILSGPEAIKDMLRRYEGGT